MKVSVIVPVYNEEESIPDRISVATRMSCSSVRRRRGRVGRTTSTSSRTNTGRSSSRTRDTRHTISFAPRCCLGRKSRHGIDTTPCSTSERASPTRFPKQFGVHAYRLAPPFRTSLQRFTGRGRRWSDNCPPGPLARSHRHESVWLASSAGTVATCRIVRRTQPARGCSSRSARALFRRLAR